MTDKRNNFRPRVPTWFTKRHAKEFRDNITESIFESLINAMNEDKTFLAKEGYDPNERRITWLKTKERSIMIKHKEQEANDDKLRELFLQEISNIPTKFKKTKYKKIHKDPCCIVINAVDKHYGKQDPKKTRDEFLEVVYGLIEQSKFYNIESIVFVAGNDVLHIDDTKGHTTKGTPVDSVGKWHDSIIQANLGYIEALNALKKIAPVRYVHVMSNHDYKSGYQLSREVAAYYDKCPDIEFNVTPDPVVYAQYGSNLFAFCHGHTMKDADLIDMLKYEVKDTWSRCKFAYIFKGHLHHDSRKIGKKEYLKEKRDVTIIKKSDSIITDKVDVMICPSISPTDEWHKQSGFTGQRRAMNASIHHYTHGRIATLTRILE